MYIEQHIVERHFRETEQLLRQVPTDEISDWMLTRGYFPENHIVPPTYETRNFTLQSKPYNSNVNSLARRKLITLSYPKSLLTARKFAVMDPRNYHDIVYYLNQQWPKILDILFHKSLCIYSYSIPVPVTKDDSLALSQLRAGRMIYEWIQMAENDLVSDAVSYKVLARTDVANFYSSIYTHSIAWALEGREEAFKDKNCSLVGNRIDKLFQYSNDARTNGIAVGSALSDLIAEVILADIDRRVSEKLSDIDFIAVRFKDDYRILAQSEDDAKAVLRRISEELSEINLSLNERKTHITELPDGLYRAHDREYFPHSLRWKSRIPFKTFEHTLLIALDVHRRFPGTSILEKFMSELFSRDNNLKIEFSNGEARELNQIKKLISLLFLVKRESEKTLCHVLAIIQFVYLHKKPLRPYLKAYLKTVIEWELKAASGKGSAFEVVWYVFFSRYLGLGITGFGKMIQNTEVSDNEFVKCMLASQNKLFPDSGIELFKKPSACKGQLLVDYLDVFKK
jgi:hypothetical protein